MDSFEDLIRMYDKQFTGRIISLKGYEPVGRVTHVDREGAWLEGGGRISTYGLPFYHPVPEPLPHIEHERVR